MIISASRRTDIAAFYGEWLVRRLAAGFCEVPNPFNRKQVSRISLRPEDVDALVLWTRNPRPLLPRLEALSGYRYYFQYTIVGNPRFLDPKVPPLAVAVETFQRLSERLGAARVIWRYDPIVFTEATPPEYHLDNYAKIAERLAGHTRRSVISLVDPYRKTEARMRGLETRPQAARVERMLRGIAEIAAAHGMEIVSCAEDFDMRPFGIRPGKCVDDDVIREAFGVALSPAKDPGQRQACGCVASRDIGMYDACLFGCRYCYATTSFERARENYAAHDPTAATLLAPAAGH